MTTDTKNRNQSTPKEKYKYEFTQEIGTTAALNSKKNKKKEK